MKRMNYFRLVLVCSVLTLLSGCYTEDEYRGMMLSGRWFGDMGMTIGNVNAVSEMEFVQEDSYWGYPRGYGYETDYYPSRRGVIVTVEHYFDWEIQNGIIYLTFDDRTLDCSIRDYRLTSLRFDGWLDGYYSSTQFSLDGYDRYWGERSPYTGYWDDFYYGYDYYGLRTRSVSEETDTVPIIIKDEEPKCVRRVNVASSLQ